MLDHRGGRRDGWREPINNLPSAVRRRRRR
ncbi:hypothetical protein PUN28_019944 [Cardiocondyla obscurior]|uniref:Uncharacterized protein n=1 Tax=Cardiocondyla obscurior TaxID=286306 RepID=A0AAW2E874_9HYME